MGIADYQLLTANTLANVYLERLQDHHHGMILLKKLVVIGDTVNIELNIIILINP